MSDYIDTLEFPTCLKTKLSRKLFSDFFFEFVSNKIFLIFFFENVISGNVRIHIKFYEASHIAFLSTGIEMGSTLCWNGFGSPNAMGLLWE
jgi:hypothetical protein